MSTHTILIAQRDVGFAEQLATELREGGYCAIVCDGPSRTARCIRCDLGYCPLANAADLMVYDPQLTTVDAGGQRHSVAVESSLAHPEVPMLLAWSQAGVPDVGTLRAIVAQAPWVHVAAHEPAALLRQVHDLLAARAAAVRRSDESTRCRRRPAAAGGARDWHPTPVGGRPGAHRP